jgi:hypothetical protein
VDDSCASLPTNNIQVTVTLSLIQTSEEEFNNLLKNVDVGKACGFDGIGNNILKLCANGISKSFTSFVARVQAQGKNSVPASKARYFVFSAFAHGRGILIGCLLLDSIIRSVNHHKGLDKLKIRKLITFFD